MKLNKWTYDYVDNLVRFANNKRIADNLRDFFPNPYTKEDAEQFIEICMNTPEDKQINRAIFYDNKAVGSISLTFGEDVYSKSAEIGYWLAEDYWGQGIVAKAIREMCRLAFEEYGMVRVFAVVYSYNKESCRVLEKNGFIMDGVLKKSVFKNGKIFDSFIYGLTDLTVINNQSL